MIENQLVWRAPAPDRRVSVIMAKTRARSALPRPASLRDHSEAGFGLAPTCRACWHVGGLWSPEWFATSFDLSMELSHPEVEKRLRCSKCGARKGYLQLVNPIVGLSVDGGTISVNRLA